MEKAPHYQRKNNRKSDSIDFERFLFLIFSRWYIFLLCILLAIVVSFFYLRHALPTYRVSTTLLIEQDDNAAVAGGENLLQGIGLRPGTQNLDNQIDIISSRATVEKALSELPFDIDCYQKRLFKKASFYPLDPIIVVPHFDGIWIYNREYSVKPLQNDMYSLSVRNNLLSRADTIISYGRPVSFNEGSFTILPNPGILSLLDSRRRIYFKIFDQRTLVEQYRKRLEIETTSIDGTILRLSLEGTNKTKDKIFLDKLTEVYMMSQLHKKNHEANRIIEFIDNQLVDVSDSLLITENRLQEFRSKNRIMDISAQAQQIIDQAVNLENEKARLTIKSNYFSYLTEYLSEGSIGEAPIAPVSMGIDDPLLVSLTQELSALQADYYSTERGVRNPLQAQLEIKIENIRQSLKETLVGIQRANRMAIDENEDQIRVVNRKASTLPIKERQLLGIERKFNLNNVLYTFLLQRRAEAQIQKASNMPDVEIIDVASSDILPIAPKSQIVYLLAIFFGFGFPFGLFLLSDLFQNKITSEDDINSISNLPLVGHIPHSRLSYNTIVLTEPQSSISEAFRSLRTRMEFFTRETKCPVIFISSTMPGEGKTFTSVNLASAYSLAGKRTVLIGFDLRRPNLPASFGLHEGLGLSTYLIGKNAVDDIIFPTNFPNLFVIPAGPIPPNPGELCLSSKIDFLLEKIRDEFDFAIIDSAPIGTVSDSYSIAAHADASILIVRHGRTIRRFLKATIEEAQSYGIKGLSILVNDLRSRRNSYRYNYTYNSSYKSQKVKVK